MSASYSKSLVVYEQIRRALQSGRYIPGEWVDPGALVEEFHASPTPVRLALARLVGLGLLEDRGRIGIYVPLPSETALRDMYNWMECLLLSACDAGISPVPHKPARSVVVRSPDEDLVKLTWQLFDAIASATGRSSLHQAVRRANDQLAPIRRAKQHLLEHQFDELSELVRYWHARDYPSLKSALRDYHERRRQLVPCIVAMLIERRDSLR